LLALVAVAVPGTAGAAGPQAKPSAAKRLDARTRARLDRALRTAMASTWSPGMVAGVWVGERGWTSARGSTQRAAGPRPALGEHTRIGSVTKTFTGTLILQLVDEGSCASTTRSSAGSPSSPTHAPSPSASWAA
jgi:D-alanyl-D-alanine carboxypeptidase